MNVANDKEELKRHTLHMPSAFLLVVCAGDAAVDVTGDAGRAEEADAAGALGAVLLDAALTGEVDLGSATSRPAARAGGRETSSKLESSSSDSDSSLSANLEAMLDMDAPCSFIFVGARAPAAVVDVGAATDFSLTGSGALAGCSATTCSGAAGL